MHSHPNEFFLKNNFNIQKELLSWVILSLKYYELTEHLYKLEYAQYCLPNLKHIVHGTR